MNVEECNGLQNEVTKNDLMEDVEESQTEDRKAEELDPAEEQKEKEINFPDVNSTISVGCCRICHEDDGQETHISPCDCKGSLALVHRSCLEVWLAESASSACEICGYQFTVRRIPRYWVPKSIWLWMKYQGVSQRRYIFNRTVDILLDAPIVLCANFLWMSKADRMFNFIEILMTRFLPLRDGMDAYNEMLMLAAATLNLLIICPFGVLSGSSLMWISLKTFDHIRQWHHWHKRQAIVQIKHPSD